MFILLKFAQRILLAGLVISIVGCSNGTPIEPWEAAKLAYKAKKRADLHNDLIQLTASVYAAKLVADCRSDQTKCIEAFGVLRFAFITTEGEDSLSTKFACLAETVFALDYLVDVQFNLERQLIEGNFSNEESARLRDCLADVEKLKDYYVNNCKPHRGLEI